MAFVTHAEAPPLREEADGAVRVGNTRVLLEMVIWSFQDGATAETMVERFSTLSLADVYAVIAYYLRHRSEVETYLSRRQQQGDEVETLIRKQQGDLGDVRSRLLARAQSRD